MCVVATMARERRGVRIGLSVLELARAAARADRLLTRDRGFYRNCFAGLPILDPSGGPASR
jgi:hypothetical protein